METSNVGSADSDEINRNVPRTLDKSNVGR